MSRTVRDSAMTVIPPHRLAFYEDLPYATWTPEHEILQRVREIETRLRRAYRRILNRSIERSKRRSAALYTTQITPEEATNIAARRERIWSHGSDGDPAQDHLALRVDPDAGPGIACSVRCSRVPLSRAGAGAGTCEGCGFALLHNVAQ